MGGAITYALLELEGVDTEPDINDIGKKGPWIIYATEDCAKQFEAKYGGVLDFTFNGILIKFHVTYEAISLNDGTGGSSSKAASSARAIASALSDIATHIVIKIYDTSIEGRITIGILNKACARSNIRMLKGNREKRKINTNEGLIVTAGKKIVWHLYVLPMMGPALGFDWPRKLLVEVDNRIVAIDYVIRESAQLGGKDKSLCIHYEPRGCKGYIPEIGSNLMGRGYKIRICSCAFEKEQYNDRKARRIESNQVNVREALGAPPSKPCQRFLQGICLLNKKARSARPATS
jgi:hypothetical protein